MNREDVLVAKAAILRCLTEDFTYGTTAKGTPLKRPKHNQALFRLPKGYAVFNGTDLTMIMDAVMLGLMFASGTPSETERRMEEALSTIFMTRCHECESPAIAAQALEQA